MLGTVTERTLVLIKPDGTKRQLIGETIAASSAKGSTRCAGSSGPSALLASQHYAEHEGANHSWIVLEFTPASRVRWWA